MRSVSSGIRMDTNETFAMPLLQRVMEIFGQDISNNLERFFVLDGGTDRCGLSVVLLVESPHIHEVYYRYPLAGDAGIYVRDVLGKEARRLFPNEPIGRSVDDGHLDFLRLGIMNVSRLPFQSKAYDRIPWEDAVGCRNHRRWRDYLECMEHIKDAPGVGNYEGLKYPDKDKHSKIGRGIGRLKDELNDLRDAIANDLIGRLEHLHGNYPDVLLVCCGEVAQKFYRRAIIIKPAIAMPNICNLPYPSFYSWDGDKLTDPEERRCLLNIGNLLWPPQQE